MRPRAWSGAPALAAVLVTTVAIAQTNGGSAVVDRDTAGPQYEAGALRRALLGSNWRHAWTSPVDVPVLDLHRFGGGLTPVKEGGNQSRTLHFEGADGRRYVFRTVAKRLAPRYHADLLGTPLGRIVEDQLSVLHPASLAMAHVLEDAARVLHPPPRLVRLPDDRRLGDFRGSFAGSLGHIAERPAEPPEGVPPFAGATRLFDPDGLLERLDESFAWRLDARAWLAARLLDGVLGDFDRGADQWEFACYEAGGLTTCRPIARDRDWAFMRANGLVMGLMRPAAPKIGRFDDPKVSVRSLTATTREFDRSHLVELSPAAWDSVVSALKAGLSDSVIDAAVRAQPPAYRSAGRAHLLATSLRARRDALPQLAREFYALVNTQADIFGTDDDDVIEIERVADGSVLVRVMRRIGTDASPHATAAVFSRAFRPGETREVRIYLQEGNDHAVVRGTSQASIPVVVVGGGGNDRLVDSARSSGRAPLTSFYDASGDNRIASGDRTVVDTRPYVTTQPGRQQPDSAEPEPRLVREERRGRFEGQRRGGPAGPLGFVDGNPETEQTWGRRRALQPTVDFKDGAGIVVGAGLSETTFGFRRNPYASRVGGRVLHALGAGGIGVQLDGDWRGLNSPLALIARVRATQFESQRFYGYGNDTPRIPTADARIVRDEVAASVAIRWQLGTRTQLAVGPTIRWVSPSILPATPAASLGTSSSSYGAAGATATFENQAGTRSVGLRRRYRLAAAVTSYVPAWDAEAAFGSAFGEVAGYVPVLGSTLALRAGGHRAWGDFPLHEAVLLGGRTTLRGHDWNRYAGDALAYGSAELRLPVGRIELLTRGELGVIALADAGRVWVDGESPGGWHTATGAGLSFVTLSRAVSVVYARGAVGRVYAYLGFPF